MSYTQIAPRSPRVIKGENFCRILGAKAFTSNAQARKWIEAIKQPKGSEAREAAIKHISDSLALPNDYLHSKLDENSVYKAMQERQKAGLHTGLTHTGQVPTVIAMNESDGDETLRDMEWMAIYQMINETSGTTVSIVDVISLVTWAEYELSDAIKTSAYKQDSASYLTTRRFGGGLGFHRLDLRNPMISLNMAVSALRRQALDHKITEAYVNIQACITAAVGAGQVTTLDPLGLPHTINLGRNTLITRNANEGFNLSLNNTLHLYYHPDHDDIVRAALFGSWYPTGAVTLAATATPLAEPSPNNALRTAGPFQLHPTFNLANNLGTAAACMAMVLGDGDNFWVDYDGLRFDTANEPKTDSWEVIGQEYYNMQCDSTQFEIVNLA